MITLLGLEELHRWVLNTNSRMSSGQQLLFQPMEVSRITSLTDQVAKQVEDEYPFYSRELPAIVRLVFRSIANGLCTINAAAFGELFIIVKHLHDEPMNEFFWAMIHPRIVGVARELYLDGHHMPAANRSMVEVETRLRELFKKLKPEEKMPSKVCDLIGALLSEKGAYRFCDTSEQSGKDYRSGMKDLFLGAFRAYRNPLSHENLFLSKADALSQIFLASQLMDALQPCSES